MEVDWPCTETLTLYFMKILYSTLPITLLREVHGAIFVDDQPGMQDPNTLITQILNHAVKVKTKQIQQACTVFYIVFVSTVRMCVLSVCLVIRC